MSFALVAAIVAVVAAGFGWICWRMALVHRDLADAYRLISKMLRAPDMHSAEAYASEYMERKIREGRWSS